MKKKKKKKKCKFRKLSTFKGSFFYLFHNNKKSYFHVYIKKNTNFILATHFFYTLQRIFYSILYFL